MYSVLKSVQTINRCDIYVLLWCIQGLNGVAYNPGIINKVCLITLVIWELYEGGIYMLPLRNYPTLLRATSCFLFMFVIYGLHLFVFRPGYTSTTYEYAEFYINSFGPIFIFYKFTKDGLITNGRVKTYFFLLFAVVLGKYFQSISVSEKDEFTNNTGYELVSLLPMIWFFKKQHILRYVLWAVIIALVLFSMKRGAILIGGICFIWMIFTSIRKSESKKSKYLALFLGTILFVGVFYLINTMLENSAYFQQRMEDTSNGSSSNRDVIYSDIINALLTNQSYVDLLIGRGANSTMELKHMAHQDWLQVAYDNGFVGICLFFNFCCTFLYCSWKSKKVLPPYLSSSFIMLFFIFFMKTLFSMSLIEISISMSMLMGFYTSKTNEKNYDRCKQT